MVFCGVRCPLGELMPALAGPQTGSLLAAGADVGPAGSLFSNFKLEKPVWP